MSSINTDALTAIAKGEKVHHQTHAKLVRLGLVGEDGRLTDAGREAVGIKLVRVDHIKTATPAEAPKADADKPKRGRKPRACVCGCGDLTNGGLFKPGHDARWAGIVGRQAAQTLGYVEDDVEIAEHIALNATAGVSDALVAKATKVARAAMGKAATRTAKITSA